MASTGFAGGLAAGFGAGVSAGGDIKKMGLYQQYADESADKSARAAEKHGWMKEDRDKAEKTINGLADIADGGSAVSFRTDGSGQPINIAAPQQSVAFKPMAERPSFGLQGLKGFAEGGLVQAANGVFTDRRPPSDVGGLSDIAQRPQPEQRQQATENLDPSQRITKAMMETDLLSNPDKLSKMQAYAEMNGMGNVIKPFLERAYTAKKQGMIDGAMYLAQGRVDDAIDALGKGGVKLEDRPVQVDPKDRSKWKLNISGAGEQDYDLRELMSTSLDIEKYLKYGMDKNESEGKRNVSDAKVRNLDSGVRDNDASVRVRNAQVGKLGEEAKSIREERSAGGLGGSSGKLPSDAQMVEYLVGKGIVRSPAEGWQQVKTNGDKSAGAWRMSLIEANVKAGMPIAESAKDVDAFLAQSGQGGSAGPVAASGAVRKYNPKTGGFD